MCPVTCMCLGTCAMTYNMSDMYVPLTNTHLCPRRLTLMPFVRPQSLKILDLLGVQDFVRNSPKTNEFRFYRPGPVKAMLTLCSWADLIFFWSSRLYMAHLSIPGNINSSQSPNRPLFHFSPPKTLAAAASCSDPFLLIYCCCWLCSSGWSPHLCCAICGATVLGEEGVAQRCTQAADLRMMASSIVLLICSSLCSLSGMMYLRI
jgi:hypothetical protein